MSRFFLVAIGQTGIVYLCSGQLTFFTVKNANPVSFGLRAAGAAILSLFIAGCGSGKAAAQASAQKTIFDHFNIDVGGHPASLQIAMTDMEQQRGLMQRPDLGKDEGMVFVGAAPRQQNYWMKDCPEALDIAFLSPDGTIAEVYPMYPNDLRTVTSHSDRLQYAVELPQGWFAANGVRPGASIDVKALAAAVKERGFDPAKYGLR
jgi:uncharacterized membrane protein (UPF0127 family)